MSNPPVSGQSYNLKAFTQHTPEYKANQQALKEIYDVEDSGNLKNHSYQRLVTDYLRCSIFYLNQFDNSFQLDKQLQRRDLDTVCAYELYMMKKHLVKGDHLDFQNFIKHHQPS